MDELKKIAPELSKIKKENPFRVPDNYFDDFSARLQTRLKSEEAPVAGTRGRIIQLLKPAIGLAAGFALVFTLAYWPLKILTPNQQADSNTSGTEINEMLYASLIEGMDENSFYAFIEDNNGKVQFSDEDLADFVNSTNSDYDIYSETSNH